MSWAGFEPAKADLTFIKVHSDSSMNRTILQFPNVLEFP